MSKIERSESTLRKKKSELRKMQGEVILTFASCSKPTKGRNRRTIKLTRQKTTTTKNKQNIKKDSKDCGSLESMVREIPLHRKTNSGQGCCGEKIWLQGREDR